MAQSVLVAFLLGALCVFIWPSARAQDAAPPTVNIPEEPLPAVSPTVPPDVPELSNLDEAFKRTSLGKEADEFQHRVEIRRLENRVANDPDVIAAKKVANAARTDLEKRNLLRDYYNLYYGRIRGLVANEELRKAVDDVKAEHLKKLGQPRVRPVPGATPPPVEKKKEEKKPKKSRFGTTR